MAAYIPESKELVKSPGELTISVYVDCENILHTITPNLKLKSEGRLIFINLGRNSPSFELGGSAFAQTLKQVGDSCPDVTPEAIQHMWRAMEMLMQRSLISAGHDRSDGGLIVTVLEMAFAGNCGLSLSFAGNPAYSLELLFNENPGLVIEVHAKDLSTVEEILREECVEFEIIGCGRNEDTLCKVFVGGECVLEEDMTVLRDIWESLSFEIEKLQRNPDMVTEEYSLMKERKAPPFTLMFEYEPTPEALLTSSNKPKIAILREEGSNGDREMAAAFYLAGFEPWDITMSDLVNTRSVLSLFKGIAFVGGFSFADTLDSGKGWCSVIKRNPSLSHQFEEFYKSADTFSLGICNGCQLMALLGWIPGEGKESSALNALVQPRFIENRSGKFESRFSAVKILKSTAILLKGMEGSTLGVWSAHGEGYAYFPQPTLLETLKSENQIPVVYVDDTNEATTRYPFNPNGSPAGVAGLCSYNGRHLAMMPHPERSFLVWQWPYIEEKWKIAASTKQNLSPWIQMFQNARVWCEERERQNLD